MSRDIHDSSCGLRAHAPVVSGLFGGRPGCHWVNLRVTFDRIVAVVERALDDLERRCLRGTADGSAGRSASSARIDPHARASFQAGWPPRGPVVWASSRGWAVVSRGLPPG